MCGIAGILGEAGEADVRRMVESIRHRGPDAQVTRVVPGATLGHARLSIIDLGAGGQPMQSADGRFWMVFNGEIYNYRDLRTELEKAGAQFRTHSDTEVLIEFVRRHGAKRLAELNGMFAFALWDTQERTLIAARDRLGKKPFYFAKGRDGSWVFGSEVRALLASGRVENRVDIASLELFLTLGYLPPDRSIYQGVSVIPPAHALRWKDGAVSLERYWSPSYATAEISHGEAVDKLRWLLTDAVKLRLMASDVPVGAFLSGGLDSSTVVALAQRQSAKPIETFSIRIKGDVRDESPFARAVAQQEGCAYHDIELDLDVATEVRRLAEIYDEPFADASGVPTFMVSKFARERLKVVLTGDGGDELFGGYDRTYLPLLEGEQLPTRGLSYRALVLADSAVRATGLGSPWERKRYMTDEARKYPEIFGRHWMRVQRIKEPQRAALWKKKVSPYEPPAEGMPADARGINRAFWFDTTTFLPGDILVKVDRAAMAVGLEPRSPLLDPRIVDFSMSLPVEFKIGADGVCKKILRDAFQDLWPESVRTRGKTGFGVPEELWLRDPAVRGMLDDLLANPPPGFAELFDMDGVRGLVRGFREEATFHANQMWTLAMLMLWFQKWKPMLP